MLRGRPIAPQSTSVKKFFSVYSVRPGNTRLPRLRATKPALGGTGTLHDFGFATDFDERYDVTEYLGSGSFGSVHVCVERATGTRFAVKTVAKKKFGSYLEQHFVRRVQHEVDMYKHMGRSLNVVHLEGVYEDEKCVDMVMQLCTGGELWKRIKRGAYGERQAARLIREVLRAVAQCHSRGVVIRDVKPENFLFLDNSPNSPLKMIDFGIADYCVEGQELHDRAGTPVYCAPEVLRKCYGLKADVWSAGIIAYQLLTARLPFENDDGAPLAADLELTRAHLTNKDIFAAILYSPLDFHSPPWDVLSPEAKCFVAMLLIRDPADRPSASEALEHPWLADIDNVTPTTISADDDEPTHSVEAGSDPLLFDDSLVQRLQRYGTYAKLKQVSLSKVASFMSASDTRALASLRHALGNVAVESPDSSFKIPYQKMVEVLKSGQWQLSEVEVRQLLSSFTIDADGCMDASEWLAALTDWQEVQKSAEWEQLVDRAFEAIDRDKSGQLGVSALESLLCGEEQCEIPDTVPAALREARADAATLSMDNAPQAKTQTVPAYKSRDEGRAAQQHPIIDRAAFARLLRMAKQDRLELFESRRARKGATRRATSLGLMGEDGERQEKVQEDEQAQAPAVCKESAVPG